jgi:hypothetical protein
MRSRWQVERGRALGNDESIISIVYRKKPSGSPSQPRGFASRLRIRLQHPSSIPPSFPDPKRAESRLSQARLSPPSLRAPNVAVTVDTAGHRSLQAAVHSSHRPASGYCPPSHPPSVVSPLQPRSGLREPGSRVRKPERTERAGFIALILSSSSGRRGFQRQTGIARAASAPSLARFLRRFRSRAGVG